MRIAVLLSAGRHPASGRTRPVTDELRAIRLALGLGDPVGLHAGPSTGGVAAALGHGIATLRWLRLDHSCDPVAALVAALEADPVDLILAGRRAEGGEDSGMLPYLLAARLGMPIVADAVAIQLTDPHPNPPPLGREREQKPSPACGGGLGGGASANPTAAGSPSSICITQAVPGGGRRVVELALPAIVTVGPAAPAPLPYAFAATKRGRIVTETATSIPAPAATSSERPYRRRPRLVRGAPAAASAADRLRQATEVAGGGRLMVAPAPEEAAAAILDFLDQLQLVPGGGGPA